MTDISRSAPHVARRFKLQRLSIPKLRIGASFASLLGLFGDALSMAYVEPYIGHRRRPQVVPDDDLEGRDSDW